ncbi:MAG: Na(+)-translocating NADH-quinone reductase subunit A [Bacteroidales bacterium]|nr:Na(+)-translocating NADH-quinone reductase subunit A [Bacteroidales bacterium]
MNHVRIRKGLNIRLKGEAPLKLIDFKSKPEQIAIHPADFQGVLSKPAIQPGEKLSRGSVVFFDKNNPDLKVVSPVSGTLTDIIRGEKRKIIRYIITPDDNNDAIKFEIPSENSSVEDVFKFMNESGHWAFIVQRPYGTIAKPGILADDIFISFHDTAPLAPNYEFLLADKTKTIKKALNLLSKLTKGKIHLIFSAKSQMVKEFQNINHIKTHLVSGPHPAGNIGTIINKLRPINKGDILFTMGAWQVYALGKTIETGEYFSDRTIALTGSEVKTTGYYNTIQGADLKAITQNNLNSENVRIISGNVLTGIRYDQDFLGSFHNQVSVIPEGNKYEMLGWILPGFKKFSLSRTYFSWLMPKKKYRIDTNLKGGYRNYVVTGEYEKVCPLNIYPQLLIKAIIVNDIDKMEQLGIYEVIEEDLALCEFVCTSKTEVQSILREGLDILKKETE